MRSFVATLALALCAVATAAGEALEKRQGTASLGSLACGKVSYTKKQVDDAVAEACSLFAAGDQLGSSKYPHQFNNREGLTFAVSGPYQEFPILSSGQVYSGKAPGADRIVVNPNYKGECVYVGAMTHNGAASRNGFVSCSETSGGGSGSTTTTSSSSRPSATSSTSTTSSTTATPTPDLNGAQGLAGMGGQGVVVGVVAAGLLLL